MMMNEQRERLIELVKYAVDSPCARSWAVEIADTMLRHGVIVPPCKVGDTVYWIADEDPDTGEKRLHVRECKYPVNGIFITSEGMYISSEPLERGNCITQTLDRINTRYAYLSKEEAEQALKERSNT